MKLFVIRGMLLAALAGLTAPVFSAEDTALEPEPGGFSSSRELYLQVSSRPEAKLGFTWRFSFPFLQGGHFLTKDNNVSLALTAEISPISLNGQAEAVWTPAAFFQLSAGGRIGSGWKLNAFGQEAYGIGLNREKAGASGAAEHAGSVFDGLLWKTQAGGALQFDLGTLIPGDWTHVVARTYHEINYAGYTAASSNESWYYENDDGENTNGFNYYGNFLVGYQMPFFLNMIGLLAEGSVFLYDTPGRGQWGDDKIQWTFSGLFSFTVTKRIGAVLLVQCRTRRNYTDTNWEDLYYRNRHIDNSNPISLEFYRAAAVLTYKF